MPKDLPIATQRQIFKLEQRVFKLEQQIVRLRSKYGKQIAQLKAENQKLRTKPISITKEQLEQIRTLRGS
jgi:chorismate mutase